MKRGAKPLISPGHRVPGQGTKLQKTPRYAQALIRQQQALALRVQGKSYRLIGEALGVTKERARQICTAALAALAADATDSAEELRALEIERLDQMWTDLWDRALGDKKAEITYDKIESADLAKLVLSDGELHLKTMDRLLAVSKARSKMLGLDLSEVELTIDEQALALIGEAVARVIRDPEQLRALQVEFVRLAKMTQPALPAPTPIDVEPGDYRELPE